MPAPAHPRRHRARIVVAADAALRNRHAPELRVPDDKRILQQTGLFEVLEQARDRTVDFLGVQRVILDKVAVRVPSVDILLAQRAAVKLDEAHAALDQSAGKQTLPAEGFGNGIVHCIKLFHRFRFLREIHRFGRAPLHAVGQFVRSDARGQVAGAGVFFGMLFVQHRR